MVSSSIWTELADDFLTFDTFSFVFNASVWGFFYKGYLDRYRTYEAVHTARQFEINDSLGQTLREDYPNGACTHAIIRGKVKSATEELLGARMHKKEQGVLHRFMTIDHRIRWNAITRLWHHREDVVQDCVEEIPFGLTPIHEKKPLILVESPLKSVVWPLRTIYDQFKPTKGGVTAGITGWMQGEHSKGIQEKEFLLKEGSIILGFGTLRHEEAGTITLEPPVDGSEYIITFDSHTRLLEFLRDRSNQLRSVCIVLGVTAAALGCYISYRLFKKYRRRHQDRSDSFRREELRSRRRRAASPATDGEPQCVVCISNAVEVLLLECGHLCLCTDCCEQIVDGRCPICRSVFTRRVAAFLP